MILKTIATSTTSKFNYRNSTKLSYHMPILQHAIHTYIQPFPPHCYDSKLENLYQLHIYVVFMYLW